MKNEILKSLAKISGKRPNYRNHAKNETQLHNIANIQQSLFFSYSVGGGGCLRFGQFSFSVVECLEQAHASEAAASAVGAALCLYQRFKFQILEGFKASFQIFDPLTVCFSALEGRTFCRQTLLCKGCRVATPWVLQGCRLYTSERYIWVSVHTPVLIF